MYPASLNAFAAPGGVIGINGGLFLYSDNLNSLPSKSLNEKSKKVRDMESEARLNSILSKFKSRQGIKKSIIQQKP